MQIKSNKPTRWRIPAKLIQRKVMLRSVMLVSYTAAIFLLGVYLYHAGHIKRMAKEWALTPRSWSHVASGLLANPERISIDVKFKNYQKLAHQREEALDSGILISGDDDYVKAKIRHADQTIPVKMRLKGDWTDHLEGDKWSFRVRVAGDKTLFGMKQFSIHHPRTRNYLMEWIFHSALRREGILGLRYEFITATLNGKQLGVYALEEHFEKRLVEHQDRREGPIVRFSEDRMWEATHQGKFGGEYANSQVDSFETTKWLSDPASRDVHNRAISLLESFRRGQRTTSEVFDVKQLATFFAITELMGTEHSSRWHNARFYYNPVTARLEPVGFDGNSLLTTRSGPIRNLTLGKKDNGDWNSEHYTTIFSDPVFLEQYLIELDRVSQREYLDALLSELDDEIKRNLRIIYSELPGYVFPTEVLYANQQFIRSVLDPMDALFVYYHQGTDNELELRVGNNQPIPVNVIGVAVGESACWSGVNGVKIPGRAAGNMEFHPLHVGLPCGQPFDLGMIRDVRVQYKLLGSDELRETTVTPWRYLDSDLETADLTRAEPSVEHFPFLVVNEAAKTVHTKPGTWTIAEDLIVPSGYRWICGEGTTLQLKSGASILSNSPLQFVGTEDAVIRINSPDGDGQGLVVFANGQRSVLEHVSFENLSNPARSGWSLTGAVTFYESPVEFQHCQFTRNRCEDGLNIVRSQFVVANSLFSHTFGDAFDSDFCKGSLRHTQFISCGNDGVDVSGSSVTLEGLCMRKSGDKAVSVGEGSHVIAKDVEISGANIAVAVKDRSQLEADGFSISETSIGVAMYRKKPEFGPASAVMGHLTMENTKTQFMVEQRSHLIVDAKPIKADYQDLKDLLLDGE